MDDTMKKYEHRHLAMSVCEHKCNVGEKYVLPQAQAFGLSWFMATAGLADIHNNNCWGRTVMRKKRAPIATSWQSSPDPTDSQTVVQDQIVVPVLALQLMQGSGRREWPPKEQGTCLQINQTRKEQAR